MYGYDTVLPDDEPYGKYIKKGKLNLVDLAGSERHGKTGKYLNKEKTLRKTVTKITYNALVIKCGLILQA